MRILLAVAMLGLGACAPEMNTVQLGNSVLCGPVEVIVPSNTVTSLRATVGAAAYAPTICAAVAGVDATGVTEPRPVQVSLPSGNTTVRVRENRR